MLETYFLAVDIVLHSDEIGGQCKYSFTAK